MAFSDSWLETDPDGDVITVSLLDDSDRLIKRALRERLEGDAADVLTGLLESGSFAAAPKPRKGACRAHVTTDAGVAALTNEDGRFVITSDSKRLWHIATAGDAELDYVPSTGTPKTITAVHTFNPTVAGAPFTLGANATGQLVTGLNADTVDSFHAVVFDRAVGRQNTNSSVSGTINETTLATISVAAGVMGANGWLRITVFFAFVSGAGTKQLRVKFGGSTFFDVTWAAGDSIASGVLELCIINRNATNSQVCRGFYGIFTSASGFATVITAATGAVDTTASKDVTVTGQLGNAADTMNIEGVLVEVLPGA